MEGDFLVSSKIIYALSLYSMFKSYQSFLTSAFQDRYLKTFFSQCSSTCGGGLKKRSLVCKRFNDKGELVEAPEILCHYATKPPTAMDCNTEVACPSKKFSYLILFTV